ncbi:MAG TPA: 16S rRNA (guanine(966)-N(2))-methyltransferase RsmD [Methylomirabilota bacterium]|nr:16S rRNA (guanine(966)-N(2))-methyltransferase RsmD [Methylomirabilota bacterium]
MRIIAGAFKGRRLVTPRGSTTRPTADQVRIALMDTLAPWLGGVRFLDLFAGAGGVGLEALSRGAAHATFVERDARAVDALRRNVATLGLEEVARVVPAEVRRALAWLERQRERFGVVFLDPPYETAVMAEVLAALGTGRLLSPPALVVAQHLSKRPPGGEAGILRAYRTRRFGETTLTFFREPAYDAPAESPPAGDS